MGKTGGEMKRTCEIRMGTLTQSAQRQERPSSEVAPTEGGTEVGKLGFK